MSVQQLLPIRNIDRLIKLGEVQRIMAEVFYPTPDRKTIIAWIEEGLLNAEQIGGGHNYYVYQSSLTQFVERYQRPQLKAA